MCVCTVACVCAFMCLYVCLIKCVCTHVCGCVIPPALNGLNDFCGLVAGQGKAGGRGVDFHGTSEGLLRAGGHAVRHKRR